jgi:hypothetical protein
VTEETTKTLEEMIMARIRDDLFDDVERRVETKVKIVRTEGPELDMEKSSKGLGEVYEDQYRRDVLGATSGPTDTDKLGANIDELMKRLFGQLDALSNLSYKPIAPTVDMTVTTQAKAISLEEALPVGVSKADTLAPEQVHRAQRAWETLSKEEMSQDERKAARRAKKVKYAAVRERKEQERKLLRGSDGQALCVGKDFWGRVFFVSCFFVFVYFCFEFYNFHTLTTYPDSTTKSINQSINQITFQQWRESPRGYQLARRRSQVDQVRHPWPRRRHGRGRGRRARLRQIRAGL